jgi:hypothetical protein
VQLFLIHTGGGHARILLARKRGPRIVFLLQRCRGRAALAVGAPAATLVIPLLVAPVAVAIPAIPILVPITPFPVPSLTVTIRITVTVATVPISLAVTVAFSVTAITAATRAAGTFTFTTRGRRTPIDAPHGGRRVLGPLGASQYQQRVVCNTTLTWMPRREPSNMRPCL